VLVAGAPETGATTLAERLAGAPEGPGPPDGGRATEPTLEIRCVESREDSFADLVSLTSRSDAAVIVLDAAEGLDDEARRRMLLCSLLGVERLAVAINRIDLLDHDQEQYAEVVEEVVEFASGLQLGDITCLPVCALDGGNVTEPSPHTPWYGGATLLGHLRQLHPSTGRNLIDPRLPVQWVIRPRPDDLDGTRRYAGRIAGGVWRPGDEVIALPSGAVTRLVGVESYNGPLEEARPPMSVAVRLEDEIDLARGDMLSRPGNRPQVDAEIDALVVWVGAEPGRPGSSYALKHVTGTVGCVLQDVRHGIDPYTLHRDPDREVLERHDVCRVALRASRQLVFDDYRRNRATGSLILIDEATNETVAAGLIVGPSRPPRIAPAPHDPAWTPAPTLDAAQRRAGLGYAGATVWLTGLPASGKSTLAGELERRIVQRGRPAYRLDGDGLRQELCGDLGFTRADREENVRRAAHVARWLADAGVVVLVALVSPHASARERARAIHRDAGIAFLEIHVDTPLELCEHRDPKGLYRRARDGELRGMTGIDDPYEPPLAPDLRLTPAPVDAWADQVLQILEQRGVLP